MPNRIIRDGICTSESINALTPEQEVLFYRLLVICDDFGRFDGRIPIVKAAAFPLRDVSAKQLEAWLAALEGVGLIVRYRVDGKAFLAVAKWDQHQRIRNARSRYPAPAVDEPQTDDGKSRSIDGKPPTVAARAGAESESESNPNPNLNPKPSAAAPLGVRQEVWDAWRRHRGRKLTADAIRLQTKQLAEFAAAGDDPNAVIEQSICNTWAGLFPLKNGTGPPAGQSFREQAKANMDAITGVSNGRTAAINGTAERVGSGALSADADRLRLEAGLDVGRRAAG